MKVSLLTNPNIYCCNFYYIRGEWNALPDVNTLIDVGTDNYILEALDPIYSGVGKRKLDLVILTHEHFDHAGGLKYVIENFNPRVIANKKLPGVTDIAYDGMKLRIGDQDAEILYTPGHSNDSICIYFPNEQSIFVGDLTYNIKTPGGTYSKEFIEVMERLCKLKIRTLYSGHDQPVKGYIKEILQVSLLNIKKSTILD